METVKGRETDFLRFSELVGVDDSMFLSSRRFWVKFMICSDSFGEGDQEKNFSIWVDAYHLDKYYVYTDDSSLHFCSGGVAKAFLNTQI